MDETYLGYRLLLLGMIIGFNAFFASAELSLISARASRLRELAAEGNVGAQAALNLLSRPERLLATVQVGVTLAGLGAGWAGEDTLYRLLMSMVQPMVTPRAEPWVHAAALVLAFLLLTFCMVVFGEVAPKNFGIKQAERYAVVAAPLLLVFYRISQPFIYVLERSSNAVSRMFRLGAAGQTTHSVEELKLIASSVRAAGRIAGFEESALDRILDLQNLSVREIMVPRNDMVSLSVDASVDHALRTLIENQYTRVPVYEHTPEKIVGILHYKDLLPVWEERRLSIRTGRPNRAFQIRRLLRPHLVVPETKPLSQMLEEFRQGRSHMAMVVDEFGTIVGMVTVEDVLEQLVGRIEDEHDEKSVRPSPHTDEVELDGTTRIRDLESEFGIEIPAEAGFETLAGFLLFKLGEIPRVGESVEYAGRRYTVLEMERNRIARVRIEKLAA